MIDSSSMTPDQRRCEEETGHDWRRIAYERDTNYGGFMECKLCGWTQADDGDYGSDFDDNYIR